MTASDFELTDSLREYVEHRLAFALSRFQDRIEDVTVTERLILEPERDELLRYCDKRK